MIKMGFLRLFDKNHYYKNTAEFLVPFIKGGNLLSIGCGDGTIEHFLIKKLKCKITGLEVTKYKESKIPVILFDGKKIPFRDKEFDSTLFIYSLHHTEDKNDIIKMFEEAKRVTKKEIIILDHSYYNLLDKMMLYTWDYISNKIKNYEVKITFNFLKEEEWTRLFSKFNFSIALKSHPFFSSVFYRLLL